MASATGESLAEESLTVDAVQPVSLVVLLVLAQTKA